MKEEESNLPFLASPLNSQGGYGNAMGTFNVGNSLKRKVKSRKDLSQPKRRPRERGEEEHSEDNSLDRYFGSFSVESKRHVWDLLQKHPQFEDKAEVRMNRIRNNTREVLHNDPLKAVNNGGSIKYYNPETNDYEPPRP